MGLFVYLCFVLLVLISPRCGFGRSCWWFGLFVARGVQCCVAAFFEADGLFLWFWEVLELWSRFPLVSLLLLRESKFAPSCFLWGLCFSGGCLVFWGVQCFLSPLIFGQRFCDFRG